MPTKPTEVDPTVAATPIKWWIIPAVIGPILLIIVIILLVCWRWKKGAPKTKVEPDTIRMLETNTRRVRERNKCQSQSHTIVQTLPLPNADGWRCGWREGDVFACVLPPETEGNLEDICRIGSRDHVIYKNSW